MRSFLNAVGVAGLALTAVAPPAVAAAVRDIYLTNTESPPGTQLYDREPLPGTHVTTFTAGQDRKVWLVIIFGDPDAHHVRGELKAHDGSVITVMDRNVDPWRTGGSWRGIRQWFSLENLRPGQYALDLSIDGARKGIYPFTLRAGTPVPVAAWSNPRRPAIDLPIWRPGFEWAYRYESPDGKGTFVWTVDREDVSDGVPCYVIKTGRREIFYLKSDLALVREMIDGALVNRSTPPRLFYVWPLAVGKMWEQSFRDERPQERQTADLERTVSVDAEERVVVPAGAFTALKISARSKRNGALAYEMWYAPEARQWVRLREHRTTGLREREMISYKLTESARTSLAPDSSEPQ